MTKTILLFFFVVCRLSLEAGSPLKVEVSAKSALLMNTETGAILWEKNAYTPLHPASTTKIITALYALEKKGHALDEEVTASHDAVSAVASHIRRASQGAHPPYRLEFGGSHMGIKVGEILPLRALLYGLMLPSGNDAANVIGEHISGSVSKFVEELNQFVQLKGCRNTVLHTPHGLPHEEHVTTAYDLALLAKEAINNPLFKEIVKARQYIRPETNKQPESILHQHNALVKPGRFFYPKAIGIKTGYTVAAGYTLVAAAEDQERKLVLVLLGCEEKELRYRDAIALFDVGFNEKKVARMLFSKGFDLFTHEVEGGKIPLQAYLSQDVILQYYPSEEPTFKTTVLWAAVKLPILAGQRVAEMQILTPAGNLLTAAPLFAVRNVDVTWSHQIHLVWNQVKIEVNNHITWVMVAAGILILGYTFYYSRKSRAS